MNGLHMGVGGEPAEIGDDRAGLRDPKLNVGPSYCQPPDPSQSISLTKSLTHPQICTAERNGGGERKSERIQAGAHQMDESMQNIEVEGCQAGHSSTHN